MSTQFNNLFPVDRQPRYRVPVYPTTTGRLLSPMCRFTAWQVIITGGLLISGLTLVSSLFRPTPLRHNSATEMSEIKCVSLPAFGPMSSTTTLGGRCLAHCPLHPPPPTPHKATTLLSHLSTASHFQPRPLSLSTRTRDAFYRQAITGVYDSIFPSKLSALPFCPSAVYRHPAHSSRLECHSDTIVT